MHECANSQMHGCSNAQMHKCTNAHTHKCTNAQMHECINAGVSELTSVVFRVCRLVDGRRACVASGGGARREQGRGG
eukprot:1597275-Pleurochrysis_carterae.AAC.1